MVLLMREYLEDMKEIGVEVDMETGVEVL